MSDPEVPQNDQPKDIDEVVGSANEGLDAAAAARADVPGDASDADAVDPDLAAFEAAERDHPGVFADTEQSGQEDVADGRAADAADVPASDVPAADQPRLFASDAADSESSARDTAGDDSGYDLSYIRAVDDDTAVQDVDSRAADDATAAHESTHSVADDAYAAGAASGASTETQVMPAEPIAP